MQVVNGPREPLLSPQLLESGELVKDSVKGLFVSREELDDYERLWHCHVYQPTWNQLQDKVSLYCITLYLGAHAHARYTVVCVCVPAITAAIV